MPGLRRAVLGARVALAASIVVALANAIPAARGATASYGPETGTVSSESDPRYLSFPFTVTGPARIDATLSWPSSSGADLNLVLKNPARTTVASTTASGPNPEQISYSYTGSASGTWRLFAFARQGSATFSLEWTVTTGASSTTTTVAAKPGSTTTTTRPSTTTTVKPGGTTTTTAPPTTKVTNYLRVFTAQNIGNRNSFSEEEAKSVARNFDLLVATPAAFKGKVAAMKSVNPKLRVISYVNASFVGKSAGPSSGLYPAEWYMRDAKGNPVQSKYDNYMMNVAHQGWISNRQQTCKSVAEASGYDGCSLDMLGTAPLDAGYTKSAPINPATKAKWTEAEYYRATTNLAKAVTSANPGLIVSGNGLRAGNAYFDPNAPSKQLFQGTVDGIAEAFGRPGPVGISYRRAEPQWKMDVDMLVDAGKLGKGVCTLTKAWGDGTQAQKDAVHELTLATFLLGTNGKSYFYFTYNEAADATVMHPWWKSNIGTPAGSYPNYAKVGNVYMRTFSNGVVVVNPTDSAASVTLPAGSYRQINGGATKSGTVSVPPTTGWVLLK